MALYNALQFTRKPDGSLYFTYDEVKALQNQLIAGTGLWNRSRLLAPAEIVGSLKKHCTTNSRTLRTMMKNILLYLFAIALCACEDKNDSSTPIKVGTDSSSLTELTLHPKKQTRPFAIRGAIISIR